MSIIVERDGVQRPMGQKQYDRLVGQGKFKSLGFKLIPGATKARNPTKEPGQTGGETVSVPAEAVNFTPKSSAVKEQEMRNKMYLDFAAKGTVTEIPEDYTGDPAVLEQAIAKFRDDAEDAAKAAAAKKASEDSAIAAEEAAKKKTEDTGDHGKEKKADEGQSAAAGQKAKSDSHDHGKGSNPAGNKAGQKAKS